MRMEYNGPRNVDKAIHLLLHTLSTLADWLVVSVCLAALAGGRGRHLWSIIDCCRCSPCGGGDVGSGSV